MAIFASKRSSEQRALAEQALPFSLLLALNLFLLSAAIPLFPEFPTPIAGLIGMLFALHLARLRFAKTPLAKSVLLLLSLLCIALVLMQFRTIFGYQAGISLFALMLGLKLLELRSERDFYICIILGLILLVCQFLLNQSMYLAIYCLAVVIGLLALLIMKNSGPSSASLFAGLRLASVLVLQAFPIILILFLFFPRLSAPLWNIDLGARTGITGLGDSMAPGSISKLILSDEPAFRVEFFDQRPAADKLYWRGPVLWRSNGSRWFARAKDSELQNKPTLVSHGPEIRYRQILEPHGKRWVLPLDIPVRAVKGAHLNSDFELRTERPIHHKQHFLLQSATDFNTGAISDFEREMGLQLPPDITERMRQLVARWTVESRSARQIVAKALNYFNQNNFIYTLSPPLLQNRVSDRFLFETRAGFCEHYASTFTVLMRLAGIPSRVVTGYLGGQYNDIGDYYLIRQSDAHAWSEVWLKGEGWVRIDPTAAIAPERVQRQIAFDDAAQGMPVSFRLSNDGLGGAIVRRLALTLDAWNTRWNIWVLGYDTGKQQQFLRKLGLDFLPMYQIGVIMIGAAASIVLIITLGMLKGFRRQKTDAVVKIHQGFCRKLNNVGIEKRKSEGALDYSLRSGRLRPDLRVPIDRITQLFLKLHYAGQGSKAEIKRFRFLVRSFKPKKKPLTPIL